MAVRLNDYYRQRFGCKVYKLSLDAGFTCPNRDGSLDTRGCIFCSGSGEFAQGPCGSIAAQLEKAGQSAQAKAERERTLGVLSFVASRSDFTPDIRDRLVRLVAMNYLADAENAEQREDELNALLKDYDAERIRSLRSRFRRMQMRPPGRNRHPWHTPRRK